MLVRSDVHGFYNQQVVIQRNDGVYQSQEDYQPIACMEGGSKYEKFRKESGERWNSGQREESQCHNETQFRIGLIKSVIGFPVYPTVGLLFYGSDNTEHSPVLRLR